jgi:hypothetical protein
MSRVRLLGHSSPRRSSANRATTATLVEAAKTPTLEDCLTHEFRLAPISDRRHEISADETVDDGQAVRCEQQHEERGEKPFCFPTGLGICEDCDGSRKSRCGDS